MSTTQDAKFAGDYMPMDKNIADQRTNYAPVKFGFLGAEMGPSMAKAYRQIHKMAFDEGYEQGWLSRRVEMIAHEENGLPLGSHRNATDGFRWLVDQGCIAIAGAYSGDNTVAVAPVAEELKVPLISWGGTEHMMNAYTFRLANGDCGGDPTLIVKWLVRHGLKRVGLISEVSTLADDSFKFFRIACRRFGIQITGVETVPQATNDMQTHLANLRATGCDALVHSGYGMHFAHDLFRPALKALNWDPPRMTGTAMQFYVVVGYAPFEGWVGLDQYSDDNPRVAAFYRNYRARYNEDPPNWPSTVPLMAYDTARVMAEGLYRASMPNGEGMRDGIERLRFLPSTVGGPRTHISGGPFDHNLFKGDWIGYAKCTGGKFVFEDFCDVDM